MSKFMCNNACKPFHLSEQSNEGKLETNGGERNDKKTPRY
jgi:hypothetical protein